MGQRGSAAIFSLGVMVLILLLMGGVLSFVINGTKLATKTTDINEAQNAAEGAIKRAAAEFRKASGYDWTWLDTSADSANWRNYTDAKQQYHVALALSSDPDAIIVPTSFDATYKATAVGRVGNMSKTVIADLIVSPPINSFNAFNYAVATQKDATFADSAKGTPVNTGSVSKTGMGRVVANGDVKNLDDPDKASGLGKTADSINVPPFASVIQMRDDKKPVITIESLGKDCYDYNETTNTYTIKNNAHIDNCTIIIKGNLSIDSAETTNANIFVDGNLTIAPAINYNGSNFIAANGDITNYDNNSLQGIMLSYGNFTGPININNGCLVVVGDANFTAYSNINYNEKLVQSVLAAGSTPSVEITNWHIL